MEVKRGAFGLGTLWMLMLFVILCLTVFATLSLLTARRDAFFTENTFKSIQDYYEADAMALRVYAQIEGTMEEIEAILESEPQMIEWAIESIDKERVQVAFKVPSGERQVLHVLLEVKFHSELGIRTCQKTMWRLESATELEYQPLDVEFSDVRIGG